MKIVRTPVLREEKNISVAMLIIAVLMLLITVCSVSLDFNSASPALSISFMNSWSAPISVIPVTWLICVIMLMKTKKTMFAKLPAYIVSFMILLALIIIFFVAGEEHSIYKITGFAVAVLLVYPFIIATLTLEGRMYNRVFATIFSGLLMIISLIAAVIICIVLKSIMLSSIIPALIYLELILIVLNFNLTKTKKPDKEKSNVITH